MNETVLIAVVFACVSVIMGALAFFIYAFINSERKKINKRFETLNQHYGNTLTQDQTLSLLKKENDWGKYPIFSEVPPFLNLPVLFEQAGMKISISKWFIILILQTIAAAGLTWWFTQNILYTLCAALGTIVLLYFNILRKRKKRLARFESSLAQALEVISRSLRAGHPLSMGIYMVYSELPDPIGEEFGRVFHQQQMGIPVDDCMKEMAQRVPLLDLRFFILSIMIHSQTGGDLAEIIDNLAGVIRERFKVLGQVKALTAEGRLSGWVLSLLPVVVFFIILLLNPNYVLMLLQDPRGIKMLYFAVGMQMVGIFFIRKIVNIKV